MQTLRQIAVYSLILWIPLTAAHATDATIANISIDPYLCGKNPQDVVGSIYFVINNDHSNPKANQRFQLQLVGANNQPLHPAEFQIALDAPVYQNGILDLSHVPDSQVAGIAEITAAEGCVGDQQADLTGVRVVLTPVP